jgi:hypothetical protein
MYEVWVYDDQYAQFIPVRSQDGKRQNYDSWEEAEEARTVLILNNPGEMFKVEYNTIRRPRRKRGY